MCGQCLSTAEAVASGVVLVTAIAKDGVHRRLAEAGLVAPIDELGRDARTVAFLRALDLDPVLVLGSQLVAAADQWKNVPARRRGQLPRRWRWAAPIGSHRRLAIQ